MSDVGEEVRRRFPGRKIAVIGDLVADQYLSGTIARVSREAPVFILRHDATTTLPGAAANAAANVASLGGTPSIVGVVGDDANGALLLESLRSKGMSTEFVLADASVTTTTKVRVIGGQPNAGKQQVIRIDYENSSTLSEAIVDALIGRVRAACNEAEAIIVSDYNYGVATAEVFSAVKSIADERGVPIVVDSRFRLREFAGATAATPNQDEVEQILGREFTPAQCVNLANEIGLDALLVTNGNKGMQLFESSRTTQIDAVGSLEPVDVTGAGDTVIAAFSLGVAAGLDFLSAARIANHAGGLVVMKKGTACVGIEELLGSLARQTSLSSQSNA